VVFGDPMRERDEVLPDGNLRRPDAGALAARGLIVARMTGKRVGLDTATGMLERGERPPGRVRRPRFV
jgi:hypothetical protein